jgi:histidine ammonia-lyase
MYHVNQKFYLLIDKKGEGKMWSPTTGIADAELVLKEYNLKRIHLKPKEGLALINGTQFITALGADAVGRATRLALQADIIAALTIEVLKGKPFENLTIK